MMKIKIEGRNLTLNKLPKNAVKKIIKVPDIWIHYELHQTEFMGEPLIIMEPIVENTFSPLRLKHLTNVVAEAYSMPAVIYFNKMEYYQRQRMMERGVYFLVENKYAFLPSLIINAKMTDKKPIHQLSPVAQYLLLCHLQVTNLTGKTARELSKSTPYLYTTLTRAINVLTELHLCDIEKDEKRFKHIIFPADNKQLYNKALPYLINPINNVLYTDENVKYYEWPIAGINALSHYSMINPEQMQTYALTADEMKHLQASDTESLNPIEGAYRLEEWVYPPIVINGYVDRLSLALTLKDDSDPRVNKEVEKIIADTLC